MASDSTPISKRIEKFNINDPTKPESSSAELVAVVDDLLNQLSTKFSSLSGDMIAKMDEMSRRLDNLEATIEAGNDKGEGDGKS